MSVTAANGSGDEAPAAIRVLFVDDDPAVRTAFKRVFERRGLSIHLAESCATAKAAFAGQGRFDVLVTDFELGAENAYDIIRAVESVDPTLSCAVVVFTARSFSREDLHAEARLGRFIVSKTAAPDELLATIRRCAESNAAHSGPRRISKALLP